MSYQSHQADRTTQVSSSRVSFAAQHPDRAFLQVGSHELPESTPHFTSEAVLARIHEPWAPSQSNASRPALVMSLDGEKDDIWRLSAVLHQWQTNAETDRPKLIIVAGQQWGEMDTLGRTRTACDFDLGSKHTRADPDRFTWEDGNVVLLRGGPISHQPALGDPSDSATLKARADAAARRLDEELQDRRYVFHNNTSCVLFSNLKETTLSNCIAHTQTCSYILGPSHWIIGANVSFDLPSFQVVSRLCKALKVPLVHTHGSTLGFKRMSINELPEFQDTLKIPTPFARLYQDDIRDTMKVQLQWATRIYGALSSNTPPELVALVRRIAEPALTQRSLRIDCPSVQRWINAPTKQRTYEQGRCDFRSAFKRVHTFAETANCPLTNTLGDYVAICHDLPLPPSGIELSPCSMVIKDSGPELVPLEQDSVEFITTGWPESELTKHYLEKRDREKSAPIREGAESIVDSSLAKEWDAFKEIQSSLHHKILEALPSSPHSTSTPGVAIHQACAKAIEQLKNGAMSRIAEGVLLAEAEAGVAQ